MTNMTKPIPLTNYIAQEDVDIYTQHGKITVEEGNIIVVHEVDEALGEMLVEVGPIYLVWMPIRVLKSFKEF